MRFSFDLADVNQVGQPFTIYKCSKTVNHPATTKSLGWNSFDDSQWYYKKGIKQSFNIYRRVKGRIRASMLLKCFAIKMNSLPKKQKLISTNLLFLQHQFRLYSIFHIQFKSRSWRRWLYDWSDEVGDEILIKMIRCLHTKCGHTWAFSRLLMLPAQLAKIVWSAWIHFATNQK